MTPENFIFWLKGWLKAKTSTELAQKDLEVLAKELDKVVIRYQPDPWIDNPIPAKYPPDDNWPKSPEIID